MKESNRCFLGFFTDLFINEVLQLFVLFWECVHACVRVCAQ